MVIALAVFLPLMGAFINAWLSRRKPGVSMGLSYVLLLGGLAAVVLLSLQLEAWDLKDLGRSVTLHTGVGIPPLSIDLEVTAGAAIASIVIYLTALMGLRRMTSHNVKIQLLLLSLVTASLGLLYATDLFNSFVFLEIGSIITIGITAACKCRRRWEVAIKVALVSGLLTILYLIAVAVVYRSTGELRFHALHALEGTPAFLVSALMLTVIMTEIKAFPLSGWGLDFYHGASPGFAGVYSGTWSLALLLWSARILPSLPIPDPMIIAWIGAGGLVLGQLAGLRAGNPGRIMGYSTTAYASLLLVLAGSFSGEPYRLITLMLMVFAAIAKFGLFMLGNPGSEDRWSGMGSLMILLPILALVGVPPMPVFWAKLRLLSHLAAGSPVLFGLVTAGLFLEAVYLLRFWAGRVRNQVDRDKFRFGNACAIMLTLAGAAWLTYVFRGSLDLSGSLMGSVTLRNLFLIIFGGGTLLSLPGIRSRIHGERSYWIWMLISGISLTLTPLAGNGLTFFIFWEVSAFAAVVAVSKGRNSFQGSFWYAVFASASGYLLLASILLSTNGFISAGLPAVLATAAALLKMGQLGAHLWNVRAYGAAPSTLPAYLAGTSSKASVLLLVLLAVTSGNAHLPAGRILAWIGALTALGMAVKASISSNYKRVLAFASVSQLGYILIGLGLASITGWTAAMYHTFHHFLFKMVLFLGAAGVIFRTGFSDYNRLGGLIRRMPITFMFTLISVIAFAGVPPLAGFGGKWLLYNGLIEAGWLPIAVVAMFASVIAFLYAFRLLYAVFLGQLSPAHTSLREAPLSLLVPQGILVGILMLLSFRPTLFLQRILPSVAGIQGLSGASPTISGTTVTTALGSWNAWAVGSMVMVLFGLAFVFYWLSGHRPRHVGQLDIGFAGELPPSAVEIQYAGNFFRPLRRALGILPGIQAERIFGHLSDTVHSLGDVVRSLFTGDGRTYLTHSLLFLLAFYLILRGGV